MPDQGQPGRPRLGGDPRGRGRRRADGRADVQVQAAGLRAWVRSSAAWPGALLRQPSRASSTRSLPAAAARSCSSPRSSSVAGNRWGVDRRWRRWSPTCPSGSASFADCRVLVFGLALMLLAIFRPAGPAAAAADRAGASRSRHEIEALEEGEASMPEATARRRRSSAVCSRSTTSPCRFGGLTALDDVSASTSTRARSSA